MSHTPTDDDLARLEAAVRRDPGSADAREQLLEALCAHPDYFSDPRRIAQIEWFVEHRPRHFVCRTPFTVMHAQAHPEAFARLKARWLALAADAPDDPDIVLGAANFVAAESPDEAARLIEAALTRRPEDASLWLELGRMRQVPSEKLAAFERARETGATLSNLLVWIATTALEADDASKAERAAGELLELVEDARRRIGDPLDWSERGGALFTRARHICHSNEEAGALTHEIADHGYRKHWAHTVLGRLAVRRDDLDRAVEHLHASADVRPDFRLTSYGPSLDLVREVCARGRWDDGLAFLRAWSGAWEDERLESWIAAVEARRLPEVEEDA